ncbi:MAG: phage tail tube protein [Lachnospiraceae bacterium]|nr:phage tail tube protein [Lachnospiraceae bacterium]
MADSVDLRQHIDCSQGKAFIDGEECMDAVSFQVVFSPVTSSTKTLGHTGEDTRWKGYNVRVTLSEYRSRPWLKNAIQEFLTNKKTPNFTFQGMCTDEQSDYYRDYGGQTVTVTGCVPTGDITLLNQDVNSDFVQDTVTFSGKDVKFSGESEGASEGG